MNSQHLGRGVQVATLSVGWKEASLYFWQATLCRELQQMAVDLQQIFPICYLALLAEKGKASSSEQQDIRNPRLVAISKRRKAHA